MIMTETQIKYLREKLEREKELARKRQKEAMKRISYENAIEDIGYSSICKKIESHCLNLEILAINDLKKVIDRADGDCLFYYKCKTRKPECGCKIKRKRNMFKDV